MDLEENQKLENEFYLMLTKVKSAEDFRKLFADLCTYNEIDQMSQRLGAAKMFLEGKTYSQITAKTKISSATLSRVSRCIQHGSGGYNEVLRNVMEEDDDK